LKELQIEHSYCFLLGRVKNEKHRDKLSEIAYWLDQNKFACTFSVVEGVGRFDICPHDVEAYKDWTVEEFRLYAAELIIAALSKGLDFNDN
jgi:hypothetical protein